MNLNISPETSIRNLTNQPFSKRTNIRILVRYDDYTLNQIQEFKYCIK